MMSRRRVSWPSGDRSSRVFEAHHQEKPNGWGSLFHCQPVDPFSGRCHRGAERVAYLDPQSPVVQSGDVLIRCPSLIAGKCPWNRAMWQRSIAACADLNCDETLSSRMVCVRRQIESRT